MRRLLLIGLLLSNIVWARYVALLTETASGGDINSQKDIVTMKEILRDRYSGIPLYVSIYSILTRVIINT
jgi:hypothetical protein